MLSNEHEKYFSDKAKSNRVHLFFAVLLIVLSIPAGCFWQRSLSQKTHHFYSNFESKNIETINVEFVDKKELKDKVRNLLEYIKYSHVREIKLTARVLSFMTFVAGLFILWIWKINKEYLNFIRKTNEE